MKTPLRTLTCALAVASACRGRPGRREPRTPARGRRARRERDAEERRAHDALAGRQLAHRSVPPDYLLPTVTARGSSAASPSTAAPSCSPTRARARAGAPASSWPSTGQADRRSPSRHRHVRRRRAARIGHLPHAPRLRHRCHAATRCSPTTVSSQTLDPVATKIVFSAEGGEKPDGWTMQGQPLTRTTRERRQLDVHALQLARVSVHPRAAARAGRLGGLHRAAEGVARPREHAAAARRRRAHAPGAERDAATSSPRPTSRTGSSR